MKSKTIGVFFGSRSTEHDVSIVTAIASIIKPLKIAGYKVVPVYIAKDGRWFSDERLSDIKTFSSGEIDNLLKKLRPVTLQVGEGLVLQQSGLTAKKIVIDIAFPATHGTHGEDGHLMGVFEMAGIPYVGCDPAAGAIAMDKVLAKQIAMSEGIPTPDFVWGYAKVQQKIVAEAMDELTFPMFVKPAHLGSSIGITRVTNKSELINAVELAAHYDDKILVEKAVSNLIEVTLPIIGNYELTTALLEEPMAKADGVFDFDTKYMNQGKGGKKMGGSQGSQGYSKLPANVPREIYDQAVELATKVYRVLGCSGIARIDMLIDSKAKIVYFNEINPLPGSLYAHNWRAAGMSNIELVEKLVLLALEKYEGAKSRSTTFSTNFLKQF